VASSSASVPPLRNSYWVVPGQVLAGEYPGGPTREKTRERLEQLLTAGIESFVDLTHPDELPPYDIDLPANVDYVRKPIKDHSIPQAKAAMTEILEAIQDSLRSRRPTYVHCRAGIGRTGTVVGCLLVERGLSGAEAVEELNRLWKQSRRSKSWPEVPETEDQARYIRDWTAKSPPKRPRVERRRNLSKSKSTPQRRATDKKSSAPRSKTGRVEPSIGSLPQIDMPAVPIAPASESQRGDVPPVVVMPAMVQAVLGGSTPSSPAAVGEARRVPQQPNSGSPEASRASAPDLAAFGAVRPGLAAMDRVSRVAAVETPAPADRHMSESAAVDGAPHATTLRGSAMRDQSAPAGPAPAWAEEDPLLHPSTLSAARGLRDRFLGALLGLAVGDAIAAATQFRRPGSFTPVGDMLGGGPFDLPRGAWSDDTAMTLCLADSLLERNAFDARDQAERYSKWQQQGYLSSTGQCVGITASTARALALAKWRRQIFAGSHDPDQLDPEPLARVAAPVLFFFASHEDAVANAADSARTTCQAPTVLEMCRRLARALHAALSGQPKEVLLAEGSPTTEEAAAQANGTAPAALEAALWAFGTTDTYRDAVLKAANLGGTSDVVAAACGQLAGAYYGTAAIPVAWRNGLIHKDLLESFADRLLAHALLGLGA